MNEDKSSLKQGQRNGDVNVSKFCIGLFALYWALIVAFFFLAGDQLHLRQSRGELSALAPETGAVELARGSVVEQRFTVKIQRLQTVSVQWGTYYRPNSGIVTMELWQEDVGALLLSQNFDVADIPEAGFTTLMAETPLEGVYGRPLLLRVYSNSHPGAAVSPLLNQSVPVGEGFALSLNGAPSAGTLCFSVTGQDYIWTGLHYWQFAVGFGLMLAVVLLYGYRRWVAGKHSYIVYALIAVKKYSFLIRQLVSRDFHTKYKRSVLGVLWSFLNPLLTMSVQYFVFSTVFRRNIPHYPAYLLIGVVSFHFFSEACGMSLTAITGNARLITKVYIPKYIYPLTRLMSSVINLAISLIPLLIVCVLTGVEFHKSVVLSLYFILCLIIFSLGLGLLLSTSMVFFRDTQFLWRVFSMMWMYATPIFYPETILPEEFRFILKINPLYHFLKNIRLCILDGLSPEPAVYVQCLAMALGMLLAGALIFRRSQDRFVLYL